MTRDVQRPITQLKDDVQRNVAKEFQAGSPDAVQEVRAQVEKIVGFRGYRIPAEERRDLVQDVMTQLWQAVNRSSFDSQRNFMGFAAVVAGRRCIDWLRTKKNIDQLDFELPSSTPSPMASLLQQEREDLLQSTLAKLDRPCRDLIYLHLGMNKPYRDLETLLGKSPGALRVQMHRCVGRAQEILARKLRGNDLHIVPRNESRT